MQSSNSTKAPDRSDLGRLDGYRAERDKAAAESIANSAAARRKGRHQDLCDGGYEVLDR